MSPLRIWLVGFGTVGRWLAGALDAQAGLLASRYGRAVTVVGIANARDGFVYHPDGLDLASVRAAAAGREVRQAASAGQRLKHVATLGFSGTDGSGTVTARVQPEVVQAGDLLARTDGVANAVTCQADPIGEVTIIGPGAGPQLAGQGVLSDIIAVTRWQARSP